MREPIVLPLLIIATVLAALVIALWSFVEFGP